MHTVRLLLPEDRNSHQVHRGVERVNPHIHPALFTQDGVVEETRKTDVRSNPILHVRHHLRFRQSNVAILHNRTIIMRYLLLVTIFLSNYVVYNSRKRVFPYV